MYKFLLGIVLLLEMTNLQAYTNEDYQVKDACEKRVRQGDGLLNSYISKYDYAACYEMLNHKDAMRKYGAASSYDYWVKRLNK